MNALAPTPRRFTSAEFTRMAQSGGFGRLRVELRRGWIVDMSPQHIPHVVMKTDLAAALTGAVREAGLGWRVDTEASIDFGGRFQPMPDIVVWDPAEAPANLDGPIPAAAVKLVIEIASSTLADDLGDKRAEYAESGLAEYWVADVKARVLHRHAKPEGGAFTQASESPLAAGAESFTIPRLALPAGAVA